MSGGLLIVGEVFVDFTLASANEVNKLRLGGITHAARGAWALNAPYAVASVFPTYLEESAARYLSEFGCASITTLGSVSGSPNVIVVADALELGDQGYEELLREEKVVKLNDPTAALKQHSDVLVIPGKYDLDSLNEWLHPEARIHIDIAYDVDDLAELHKLAAKIETIFISTSSALFSKLIGSGIQDLVSKIRELSDCIIVLKENRGGSRLVPKGSSQVISVPAILGETKNSVGVGDVYDAAFVHFLSAGPESAAWKAGRVSAAYAQTTFPDTFKSYTSRSLLLSESEMKELGGVRIPWEVRPNWQIYLAAPDFSYQDTRMIEHAVRSLEYHNFRVRRPVKENGELDRDSPAPKLAETYHKDVNLLADCALVFAMPLGRDAGTLIEMGMAMQTGTPVVAFDPTNEARNTMVVAGADCYSQSLDECINAVFEIVSRLEND